MEIEDVCDLHNPLKTVREEIQGNDTGDVI